MKRGRPAMQQIEEALARANPVPAQELGRSAISVEAKALHDRILNTPPDGGRHHTASATIPRGFQPTRKAWAAIGAAAAVAAIVISAQVSGPRPAARPYPARLPANLVEFTRRDGTLTVKITDPRPQASQLTAIFKAHGLNINVSVIPVPPSLVGTIVYSDIPTTAELQGGICKLNETGRCWIGFVLPAGFKGSGDLTVGRQARPGEKYESGVGPPQPPAVPGIRD